MGTKQPKLNHEYPNLLLKKINVNNPPDVLLLGNGLNRLIEFMLPILRILSQQGIKTLYFCDVIKELKCNKGLAI